MMEVDMNWSTSQMSAYGDNAADRMESFADDAKSTAADVRSRVADAIEQGTDWASKRSGDLDAPSKELVASMSDAVSARPFLAVSVAAVAGFLLYHLFSRD